ncbi:polysaccharide biosynthesis/export family protein [Croceicoccus sp. F390]|uniref:Polysaccharide biosynthesis/export family protein n=1 Tax=Croceicoccus esteveae TaxID=3075597 RepID=A0ABU2ZGL9_9SPHN|nr:polysaccharide biosynthesis/export family protein [Croceicoccus sp. F390]MDT0575735.1 polysaccharide biosynthesis/export family protein [Croceicoccus sp. F390]
MTEPVPFRFSALAPLVCLALSAGCQSSVAPVLPTGTAAYDAIALAPTTEAGVHVIAIGDRIDVRVFREEDLGASSLLVDGAGNVALPMLGEMRAAGLTQRALGERIAQMLRESLLRDPRVTVSLAEAAMQTITVEGEVAAPGVFQIQPGHTLLSALALAKSPQNTALLDEIMIFRSIDGRRAGARFDVAQIRAGRAPDPLVQGGDVVVVGFSQLRRGYQDVLRMSPLLNVFTVF